MLALFAFVLRGATEPSPARVANGFDTIPYLVLKPILGWNES